MSWREMVGEGAFRLRGANRGILLATWWNVALLVGCVAALPFDHRVLLGLNPWVKPIKFEISTIVYAVTVAGLLAALGRRGARAGARRRISWGVGVAMVVENTLITLQSARGVTSHFNYTSALNGGLFAVMGVFIVFNTVLIGWLLVLYVRTDTGLPAAVVWGVCLGLGVFLAGSVEGVLMVMRYGAHTVGAADGGAGLPFVNWSVAHGDLRVAHFFALHALQVFVVVGWLWSRVRVGERMQVVGVVGSAAVYAAGVWGLFAQAMAGRPVGL